MYARSILIEKIISYGRFDIPYGIRLATVTVRFVFLSYIVFIHTPTGPYDPASNTNANRNNKTKIIKHVLLLVFKAPPT